jgi:hypothetical protein
MNATEAATLTPDQVASFVGRVVDIREETEISFTIPYVHSAPWLPNTAAQGTIIIMSLNALRYSLTPSIPVSFNMYISAGEDFQVAAPTHFPYNDTLGTNIRSMKWPLGPPAPPAFELLESQGITREGIRSAPAPGFMDITGSKDQNLVHGETIEHIKDLLLRPMPFSRNLTDSPPGKYCINPYSGVPCSLVVNETRHWWDYYRLIFRYSRGSFDMKLWQSPLYDAISSTNASFSMMWRMVSNYGLALSADQTRPYVGYPSPTTYDAVGYADGGINMAYGHEMPLHAQIPYYATNYFMPNYGIPNSGAVPVRPVQMQGSWPFGQYITNVNKTTLFVSAGDDVQFGFMVGPPVMYISDS